MANLMRRKKIEQQERELRELIVYRYGVEEYTAMMRDRAKISGNRRTAENNRRRKIKNFILNIAAVAAIVALLAALLWLVAGLIENLR